jgi:hypothetical protein
MAHSFIVSPAQVQQMEESGLAEKIKTNLPDFSAIAGYWHPEMLDEVIADMHEEGELTRASIQQLLISPSEWITVWPDNTEEKEAFDVQNIPILSGYLASLSLSLEELLRYREYGFETYADCVGTIGAYIKQVREEMSNYRRGHNWQSEKDNQQFSTHVTAVEHLDPAIIRKNISTMKTTDPLGHSISYRPLTRRSVSAIYPGQSTELKVLGGLLRYVHQQNVACAILENNGRNFLDDVRTWRENLGPSDELTCSCILQDVRELPLHKPDANRVVYWDIARQHGGAYAMHLDEDSNLAFSVMNKDAYGIQSVPSLILPPEDIDNTIRGIFIASHRHLVRTSLQKLIDLVEGQYLMT